MTGLGKAPEGRKNCPPHLLAHTTFFRPSGTWPPGSANPAINRWAILKRPSGTKNRAQRRLTQAALDFGGPTLRSFAARSFVKADFFQQRLEARLGSQGVENLKHFETPTISILLVITFLQPIQGLVLFAESKMEKHPQPR